MSASHQMRHIWKKLCNSATTVFFESPFVAVCPRIGIGCHDVTGVQCCCLYILAKCTLAELSEQGSSVVKDIDRINLCLGLEVLGQY